MYWKIYQQYSMIPGTILCTNPHLVTRVGSIYRLGSTLLPAAQLCWIADT